AAGGMRVLYVPAELPDVACFLRQLPAAEPALFVGLGSNLLGRDGGFPGSVILMHAATRRPELRDGRIYAEAWVAAPKVARFAAMHARQGAEFLAGVPGTVGGALAMNAGCYGAETWDIVEQVLTVDREGAFHTRRKPEFEIGYRHCALPKAEWFAAAWFELESGDGDRKSTRLNSSHLVISYAVFCLKKKMSCQGWGCSPIKRDRELG